MREIYKGYEIDATRDSKEGNLYYSVFREEDGLEVVCDFTSGDESEAEYVEYMKARVDEFIKTEGASEEMADEY